MTTWRKYGLVWVSAGLLISGSLWWLRRGSHIRGEDCAELISAVMERQAVAYLMGTNTPAFVSNVVPVWVEWKMMREKILDGALNVATNGGVRTDPPSRLPVVFWVGDDTSFADGATVCGNGAGWVITAEETNTYVGSGIVNIERNYSLSPVSNAWQAAVTPDARYGGTDRTWQFKKGVSTNNAPVADELYSCTNSFFKTKTNWWTNIGNGTNNYLYWSERYLDSGRVTVTLLSGGGFTDVSPEIIFTADNYASPQNVRLQNTASNTAAYYQIEVSGVVGHTHVGVAQWPVAAAVNPRVKQNDVGGSAFVSSGGSIDLVMASEFLISAPWDVNLSYSGDLSGPSAVSAAEAPYMYAPFTVTCPAGGGGTLTASCPQTGSQHKVVIVDSAQNADITIAGAVARQVGNLAVAEIGVSLADPPPVGGWQQSRAITTNYLNQAANVLSNLTRTVCFFNGADLDGTNCVRVEWSGVEVATNQSVWSWQSSPKDPIEFSSIVGDIWDATLLTATCQTNTVSFDGELASASRRASEEFLARKEEAREDPDFWDEHYNLEGLGSARYSSVRIINAFLPYPSDYALTNGLVKRVRVYAIVTSSIDGYDVGRWSTPYNPINSISFAASPALESYTLAGSTEPLHKMLHEGLGIGADVGRYEVPAFNENGWTLALTPNYSTWSSAYTVPPVVIMRLLADVADPTSRVPITIGAPFKWPDYYVEVSHDAESGRYDKGDGYDVVWSTGHYKFRRQRVTVYLSMLAVVVDWKWDYLNPANPYTPTPYTPPWVSANTNSP